MASRPMIQTANYFHQQTDPLLNHLFNNINKYSQIPIKSFAMSVRYIHTQAQALAELERERVARRASYARRKERTLNDTSAQAQIEREQQRAVHRSSDIQRKETMLNDPEYRNQVLQNWKASRDKKRQAIEDDPLHVNARKDADRMAKVRKIVRET
jgi:hypothetical protein